METTIILVLIACYQMVEVLESCWSASSSLCLGSWTCTATISFLTSNLCLHLWNLSFVLASCVFLVLFALAVRVNLLHFRAQLASIEHLPQTLLPRITTTVPRDPPAFSPTTAAPAAAPPTTFSRPIYRISRPLLLRDPSGARPPPRFPTMLPPPAPRGYRARPLPQRRPALPQAAAYKPAPPDPSLPRLPALPVPNPWFFALNGGPPACGPGVPASVGKVVPVQPFMEFPMPAGWSRGCKFAETIVNVPTVGGLRGYQYRGI